MQGCPKLGTYIEKIGPASREVEETMNQYVKEGYDGIRSTLEKCKASTLHFGLCCTHYGYSIPLWEKALTTVYGSEARSRMPKINVIDPNASMALMIFQGSGKQPCSVTYDFRSKMLLFDNSLAELSPLLTKNVAAAVQGYTLDSKLFDYPWVDAFPPKNPQDDARASTKPLEDALSKVRIQ